MTGHCLAGMVKVVIKTTYTCESRGGLLLDEHFQH